jgi:hypothetical protein
MFYGGKRQDAEARGQHRAGRRALPLGGDEARTDDLRDQWKASQADITESVQVLEALFQKFDVDPALARELGTALTQLGEELLAAEEDASLTGATAAVVIECDATQNHQGRGPGAPTRRPRDLN